jgi:hypothetical protein
VLLLVNKVLDMSNRKLEDVEELLLKARVASLYS